MHDCLLAAPSSPLRLPPPASPFWSCAQEHVPNDTDIVFVEYASNDFPRSYSLPLDNYERWGVRGGGWEVEGGGGRGRGRGGALAQRGLQLGCVQLL